MVTKHSSLISHLQIWREETRCLISKTNPQSVIFNIESFADEYFPHQSNFVTDYQKCDFLKMPLNSMNLACIVLFLVPLINSWPDVTRTE